MKAHAMLSVVLFMQVILTQAQDTVLSLQDIQIKGLESKSGFLELPASVVSLGPREMNLYANASLVPVFNQVAGVRMEERSPGSYRLSIRGSLLRSPFGVRNVKVYWKDIPLTDAGGNTYLNLIDFNGVGGVEILKGPAGSVYGAGTGGVVTLRESDIGKNAPVNAFMAQITGGAYGMRTIHAKWQHHSSKMDGQVLKSHQEADGYRRNSQLRRDVTQFTGQWRITKRHSIDLFFLYADLAYRTPGGLTFLQMQKDPRQARPATATLPSAEQQQAGVFNRTLISGFTHNFQLSTHWQWTNTLTGTHTYFQNPFITNYETRREWGIGFRSKLSFSDTIRKAILHSIIGLELQEGRSLIDSTGNMGGVTFGPSVRDQVRVGQRFAFAQMNWTIWGWMVIHAGISTNAFDYRLLRDKPGSQAFSSSFNPKLLPRLGLLFRMNQQLTVFASLSGGYSAPGLAEIKPSAGGVYSGLQAENGWNRELGIKGSLWRSRLRFEFTLYRFSLRDAIVRRVNTSGAEYFINAGSTSQKGLEWSVEAVPLNRFDGIVRQIRLWNSGTLQDFKFVDYQVGSNIFSGNRLTGVPQKIVVSGVDILFKKGIYSSVMLNYTGSLPLTDANDSFAGDYRLWQARIGWKKSWKDAGKLKTELFFGGDNLANENYSLGNDINAIGGRFFNPSMSRNFFAGIRIDF